MLNLGWIRLGGTLGKIFLLICSIIIGLGFFYCTPFSLLGFGSGNSMHVPKSFRFILWQCVIYYHWNLLMCNVGCIFNEFEWGVVFPMGLLIWYFGQCFCIFSVVIIPENGFGSPTCFSVSVTSSLWKWFLKWFWIILCTSCGLVTILLLPFYMVGYSEGFWCNFFDSFKYSMIIVYSVKFM